MEKAEITYQKKKYALDVLTGTEGEQSVDIRKLRSDTGLTTFDPGYANTASCKSAITFIDGEHSVLSYRGHLIEDLASSKRFLEVVHLLVRGQLPTESQLQEFEAELNRQATPPEGIRVWFRTMPKSADPMAVLAAAFAALPAYAEPTSTEAAAAQLMAQSKALVAHWYRRSTDEFLVEPDPALPWTTDFLRMMFMQEGKSYEPPKALDRALNLLLLLHADHEQNCSTSTARMVASSDANLFAAISAATAALSGPRHGGASLAVVEMLEQLQQAGGNTEQLLSEVQQGKRKLMGFGHRVYKNHDPRARILKGAAYDVIEELQNPEPLLALAVELEHTALEDDYFKKRRLYPNVDFYSGLIYRAMGLPKQMYPVMFALGRLPGWIAHFMELRGEDGYRIHRPRQLYVGEPAPKRKPR